MNRREIFMKVENVGILTRKVTEEARVLQFVICVTLVPILTDFTAFLTGPNLGGGSATGT